MIIYHCDSDNVGNDQIEQDPLAIAASADGVPVFKFKSWRLKGVARPEVNLPLVFMKAFYIDYERKITIKTLSMNFKPKRRCSLNKGVWFCNLFFKPFFIDYK